MKLSVTCWSVVLALGLAGLLQAQTPPIRFERIDSEAGLSHNTVLSILQDRQGFLWVGTSDGLNRYDGHAFVTYRHDPFDTTSLSNNTVKVLLEDRTGTLWAGTDDGLNRFDHHTGRFVRYHFGPDSLTAADKGIKALLEDQAGRLWVGTSIPGHSLNLHDPRTDHTRAFDTGVISSLHEDQDGILWANSAGKIYKYDPAADQVLRIQRPSTSALDILHEDDQDRLWIQGSEPGGVAVFDPQTERTTTRVLLPGTASITYVLDDSLQWIGTTMGLYQRDPATSQRRYLPLGRASDASLQNHVTTLYKDRADALWVGTLSGLYRFDPHAKPFHHLGHDPLAPNSLSHGTVMAVWEDDDGVVWVGTLGGGLNRVDRQTGAVRRYRHGPGDPGSLCSDRIWALYGDRRGRLWIGTDGGLCALDRRTHRFTRYGLPPTAYSWIQSVHAVREDRAGRLWVATDAGLFQLDGETGVWSSSIPRAPGRFLQSLHVDQAGALWFSTMGGKLYQLDPATQALTPHRLQIGEGQELVSEGLWAFHEDGTGACWIGSNMGLTRFNPQTGATKHYTDQDGLPGSIVYAVLDDDRGRLWLSTNRGLARFDPHTETFRAYDTGDGLRNMEFNRRAAFKGRDGTFYFGGLDGLTSFFPEQIQDNPYVPPVVLTHIETTNADTTVSVNPYGLDHLKLSYRDYLFSFEFAALNFTNAARNRYVFQLEGLDERWMEASTQRRADYRSIPPGSYVFRVRGSNNDGVWNEEGVALRVTIAPPWWRTRWAYGLFLLLGLGTLYGVVRRRSERLKRHARQLERQVAERTAEVEQQKSQLEQQNAHIEAQAEKLRELDAMKSRFFANISHEFRTPLTLIQGPVEDVYAGKHGALSTTAQDHLGMVLRNTRHLGQLIDQLLALARLEAGKLLLEAALADLVGFLRRVVSAFASLAERRRIALSFEADTPTIDLYFDAGKLEQVITNLLSNAFKFTEEGGQITVSVQQAEAEAAERGTGSFVAIRVADTGVGIPAAQLPHVFDRFYQADSSPTRRHEGTGIGLALVRELAALHGGAVSVESEEGRGATFTVLLPEGADHLTEKEVVGEQERGVTGTRERAKEEANRGSKIEGGGAFVEPANDHPIKAKILVVEDNDDMRAYLREQLAPAYQVVEAVDGEEGLAKAREQEPTLVISDVMMPRMDGLALLRALKQDEALATVPVILLTARAEAQDRLEGFEAMADDYIAKPFHADELLVRVRNLIDIRQALQAQYSRRVMMVTPADLDLDAADTRFLEEIRTALEARLDAGDDLDVQGLAEALFMSKRKLERRLKDVTGQTPGAFIRQMRLERARQLLEKQAVETVAEAAYAVGFHNPGYFSRLYRNAFGHAPSEPLGR